MVDMMRLVQLRRGGERRVALVDEPRLRLLANSDSVYALAGAALARSSSLRALVEDSVSPLNPLSNEALDYDEVYAGRSAWQLITPIDHPEPSRCLVSGTGLTHLGSAANRNTMHGKSDDELTDSMRMFRAGLEAGRPKPGCAGIPPEWFYKGTGAILRAHGDPLVVPPFAGDGGEEAEIAGVYIVDRDGRPRRIGMAAGNEFSDHKFEKTNYLNLASSKLRTCAIGPELVIDPDFQHVPGDVSIERAGLTVWQKHIASGEAEMCHSLANIEHHHFKFDAHRRAGDLHVHFYGAHSLSFGDGIELADGDVMVVQFAGFGRPLRNPLRKAVADEAIATVVPL